MRQGVSSNTTGQWQFGLGRSAARPAMNSRCRSIRVGEERAWWKEIGSPQSLARDARGLDGGARDGSPEWAGADSCGSLFSPGKDGRTAEYETIHFTFSTAT